MDYRKISFWQLAILAFLLNFVVQTIHEAGHWAVLESSGRKPLWGFTQLLQIWDGTPIHPDEWIETAGPDGKRMVAYDFNAGEYGIYRDACSRTTCIIAGSSVRTQSFALEPAPDCKAVWVGNGADSLSYYEPVLPEGVSSDGRGRVFFSCPYGNSEVHC